MVEFLSPEWVASLADAASSARVADDLRLVVQQVVVDGDPATGGAVTYAVRISGGTVTIASGPVEDADVTFRQDRATAAAVARGDLSAQDAFLAGRLRVGGQLDRAREAARVLADLPDLFAGPRAATTW